jgi:hypothetical protein
MMSMRVLNLALRVKPAEWLSAIGGQLSARHSLADSREPIADSLHLDTYSIQITVDRAAIPYERLGCTPRVLRSAMTLPEVMVGVALSSIVMGVLISLTIALKQRDRAIHSFAVESDGRCKLAELLRADIRSAIDVSISDHTMLVVTRSDGGEVRYELTPAGCKRSVSEPTRGRPRIDLFTIGKAAAWKLEMGPHGRRPLFVVTLNRALQAIGDDSPTVSLLVYAALGADVPAARAAVKPE